MPQTVSEYLKRARDCAALVEQMPEDDHAQLREIAEAPTPPRTSRTAATDEIRRFVALGLFGGSDYTISLQPVSFQGQTGIGAVGGISALQLQSVDQLRRRRR